MKRSQVIFLLMCILTAYVGYGLYSYAVDSPHRISSEDAKARIQNHQIDLILDVRTDLEPRTRVYQRKYFHGPQGP